jgi:hypothetical protein
MSSVGSTPSRHDRKSLAMATWDSMQLAMLVSIAGVFPPGASLECQDRLRRHPHPIDLRFVSKCKLRQLKPAVTTTVARGEHPHQCSRKLTGQSQQTFHTTQAILEALNVFGTVHRVFSQRFGWVESVSVDV